MMEEQRLLKRKKKTVHSGNKRQIAEVCHEVGDYYNRKHEYELAIREYKTSCRMYEELKLPLETARCHRMIGEMHMFLAEFEDALNHEEIYLSIAKNLNNEVEEQRALATIGRICLLHGQSSDDPKVISSTLTNAEKAFTESLNICESLKGKISTHEFMDMKARLLLNIGVVLEHQESFQVAVDYLHKAIKICKNHDLFDLLNQCYITEGIIYSNKQDNNAKALGCFNLALDVASRLENKVSKVCEALALKADTMCKMNDYHSAKPILLKAWKMKSPDENEHKDIEAKLKTVAAMCCAEDLLITADPNNHTLFKTTYEKLGDGACSLKNYRNAIGYYLKMLQHAEKAGSTGRDLIPIYISLYQTYKDLEMYDEALAYHNKEYELIRSVPREAFTTLMGIADVQTLSKKPYTDIHNSYHEAAQQAKKDSNKKGEIKAWKYYLNYVQKHDLRDEAASAEKELAALGCQNNLSLSDDESSSDNQWLSQNTPNIGDDICIEDLTDTSDVEEAVEKDKPRVVRKRGKMFAVKKNCKGETQLHLASISGNALLVTHLLAQGHPVNVRDHAGWLPIHEASNSGHRDVVEILVKNGAHLNDRGGTQCDGVTPLCDAASNGHLEIVELLLNSGASPALKNDHGETALDILKKWRKNADVEPTEHIFYETLCGRMKKYCNQKDDGPTQSSSNKTESKTESRRNKLSNSKSAIEAIGSRSDDFSRLRSEGYTSCNLKKLDKANSLKFSWINTEALSGNDDTSNSSVETVYPKKTQKDTGVLQYKNAIDGLKKRHNLIESDSPDYLVDKGKAKGKKGALLEPNEVGEDWLEDDLFTGKKRKRTEHFDFNNLKRKSDERSQKSNSSENNVKNLSREVDIDDYDFLDAASLNEIFTNRENDAFEKENVPSNSFESVEQKSSKSSNLASSSSNRSKKYKRQSSLLKAGFRREKSNKSQALSVNYSNESDSESSLSVSSSSSYQKFNQASEEPLLQHSLSMSSLQSRSSIGDNYTLRTGVSPQKNLPPTAIRVRVKDTLLLIPVMQNTDALTIEWLVHETAKRYYNIEGVEPTLKLVTLDGAVLENRDPLSLAVSQAELCAQITDWILRPLSERYIEFCLSFQQGVDDHIRNIIEDCQSIGTLDLSDLCLNHQDCQPIFKAISRQFCLKRLILSNNVIGNDGLKYLAECLPTLTELLVLNLSNNAIDSNGLKTILHSLEKQKVELKNPIELNLNFNFLGEEGFHQLIKISRHIKIKALRLKACDIAIKDSGFDLSCFNDLECLDLSLNDIQQTALVKILSSLRSIVDLKLEGLKSVTGSMIGDVLSTNCNMNLRLLDLSRCDVDDSDISLILRSASRFNTLQHIDLRYNTKLTSLSLKRLLQHSPSFIKINLEGCEGIFKYLQESEMNRTLLTESSASKMCFLRMTGNQEDEDKLQRLSDVWSEYQQEKAVVETDIFSGLTLCTKDFNLLEIRDHRH